MNDLMVQSEIGGSVWKILVKPGDRTAEDEPIMILESMKMEIPVLAPGAGTVHEIKVEEGQVVAEGDLVAIIKA
jgi:acetyl-CoA carboxylase biotin carboxyl carrier protein